MPIQIRPAEPAQWAETLQIVFQNLPAEMRGRQIEARSSSFASNRVLLMGFLRLALANRWLVRS